MAVTLNASTSAGLVQTADTSGVLALQSNGTTALSTSGANVTLAGTLTTAGVITNNLPSSSGNIVALNNTAGERFIIAGDSGGIVLGTEAASTHTSLRVIAADSVVSTFSTTGLAITGLTDISAATSGQIKFPATQNASSNANTLDDYEEGTWTPVVTSGGGSITSYSAEGTYIKIGRSVFLTAKISLTTVGTASGNMNIASLPFTSFATNMQMPIFVREVSVTGQTYQFFVGSSSTSGTIQSLSGGSPAWTNSYTYAAMGVYPSAN
jgi:hypothetical protein